MKQLIIISAGTCIGFIAAMYIIKIYFQPDIERLEEGIKEARESTIGKILGG